MPGAAGGLGMPMAAGATGEGGTRRGPAAGGVSGATGTPAGLGIDGEGTTVPIT